jgi:hypothetical protein
MKTMFPILGLSALLAISCATVQQNIDARTFLAKCRYEYAGVRVSGLQFSTGTAIDSIDLELKVKITNTTDRDVALDHADLSFALDNNPVLELAHRNFVRVVPKASATEAVATGVPFAGILKTLGHRPKTINIKAKLWVTLLVGKDTWKTPIAIPLAVDFPIPYDQIDALVAQKAKQLANDAAAKAAAAAKHLPPIQLPTVPKLP